MIRIAIVYEEWNLLKEMELVLSADSEMDVPVTLSMALAQCHFYSETASDAIHQMFH